MELHIDFHCHSKFSADGVANPDEMIVMARNKGLHGFVITDHNTCACVDYYEQTGRLRADGLPVDGFLIIPGQEITTAEGHLLAVGMRLPDLKGISPEEAVRIIHDNGGIAIAPHPYDIFRAGLRESLLNTLDVDAIEVFNAATTFKHFNRKAFQYASERGLPMTAGSDAHNCEALGTAFSILEADDFSVKGILTAVRKGSAIRERYLSPREAFRKTWNNVFRQRRSQ